MRRSAVGRRRAVLTVAGLTVGLAASGVASGAVSADAAVTSDATPAVVALLQASSEPPALLDYFTFIPQAFLLLIAVGLRRYVLDDEDVPWWLDGDALRARVDAVVPDYGQRLRARILARLSTPRESTPPDQPDDTAAASQAATASDSASTSASSKAVASDGTASQSGGATRTKASLSSAGQTGGSQSGGSQPAGRDGRTSGPVPDRLALGYGNQRIVVGDGRTVDEEVRAMLRAADEGDHAKWIDDRHLRFLRDEHGFTLVVDGENPTRLNGERLRPGDRARVYPSDEIELSGVVTLSVERA